jgi:hypothetical protein
MTAAVKTTTLSLTYGTQAMLTPPPAYVTLTLRPLPQNSHTSADKAASSSQSQKTQNPTHQGICLGWEQAQALNLRYGPGAAAVQPAVRAPRAAGRCRHYCRTATGAAAAAVLLQGACVSRCWCPLMRGSRTPTTGLVLTQHQAQKLTHSQVSES